MARTKHDVEKSKVKQSASKGKQTSSKGKQSAINARPFCAPGTPRKALASRSAFGGPMGGVGVGVGSSRGAGKTVPGGMARFTVIQSAPAGGVVPKSPHRYRPGTVSLREIRRYQRGTELLMKKTVFNRWVRELLSEMISDVRVCGPTFECLQVSLEEYLVHMFEETHLAALHGKTVTLKIKDINLVKRIHNERWRH
jgi:histone H3